MTATMLSPERQRALEYLTQRAEAIPAPQIRARVRAAVAEFEAAIDGVDEATARTVLVPGEWTIAQVVDHLAQTTIRSADELRHLLEGRQPPAPPVYEALTSGAAHRIAWEDLTAELAAANAEFDALLGRAVEREPAPGLTVRTILVINRTRPDGRMEPDTFDAELGWKGYALTARLHLLDHRTQVRALRKGGETLA
jgi:DinB superfamily